MGLRQMSQLTYPRIGVARVLKFINLTKYITI